MPETMTGGDAIINALIDHGVDTLFGLPGVQTYPLFDALARRTDKIRTYSARHEQATAYMAFGYAQATGKVGVYSVVPGPGVLNTMAALCTAWACNLPVLCVTGQVPSAYLESGRGHLHEIPDQLGVVARLCKYTARIERPEDAPRIVAEAFRAMRAGRPGPALIEMCWDDMASSAEVAPFAPLTPAPAPIADHSAIEEAAALARGAERPLIVLGSGARGAAAEAIRLAELLNAPVTAFRGGRGIVPADHPLALSTYAAWRLWEETDLVIGIGSRLEMPYMRWEGMSKRISAPEAPPHLIRIDIDPAEMARLRPHVAIVADAADATGALIAALEIGPNPPLKDLGRLERARAQAAQAIAEVQPHVGFLEALRGALPRNGVFVDELTQAGYASFFAWDVFSARSYISSGFQGNLGYGFMTALGVKVGRPDAPVLSITGDGGFLYGASELATAVKERIPLITVLFNNNAYGNVRRDQIGKFDGRTIASDFANPDFGLLAKAYGVAYQKAEGAAELAAAVSAALSNEGPTLIEVPVDLAREVDPWPYILKP
ncbi:MAG: thiamine pyrophosphate-dependent enzyme [Paracoccaceae bacterium]